MTAHEPALWWRPETKNSKTGAIPTASVSAARAEESCKGCPMYRKKCYAWTGNVSRGHKSMTRAQAKNPHRYTLRAALAARRFSARYVRLTAIGDPTGAPQEELRSAIDAIVAEGLEIIGYTSQWKRLPAYRWLRSHLLASTHSDSQTRAARADGWHVSQVVSVQRFATAVDEGADHITTKDGHRLRLCPHMVADWKGELKPQCNDCGQCTTRSMQEDGYSGVAFPEHGISPTGRAWHLAVKARRGEA